jgi:hypothetical protein
MKARLLEDVRGLVSGYHKTIQHHVVNGLGDIYVAGLVERLNYCRSHPKSSKCQ